MTKEEFLSQLRTRLSSLPQGDLDRSLEFYSEMIDDRMEDGMSEREAVANMGDLSKITEQILSQGALEEAPKPTVDVAPSPSRYVLRNPWVVGLLSPLAWRAGRCTLPARRCSLPTEWEADFWSSAPGWC